MASPLQSRKKTVDLVAPATYVSRIRRDPPPVEKVLTAGEVRERHARTVVFGIVTFALALFVVLAAFTNAAGWSPSQYTWHINQKDG
ncbi:MAG: hypothetical protein ABIT69_00975 [Sphingomicrobium sp.]